MAVFAILRFFSRSGLPRSCRDSVALEPPDAQLAEDDLTCGVDNPDKGDEEDKFDEYS